MKKPISIGLCVSKFLVAIQYMLFRETIYDHQTDLRAKFVGSIEVDESYFGAKRQRGCFMES